MLPGQDTLIACWSALAETSPGARVHRSTGAVVATFPRWLPLNNAIVLDDDPAMRSAVASEAERVYAAAGVDVWALWVASCAASFEAPDRAQEVAGLRARHDDARHAGRPGSRAPLARRGRRSIAHRHRPPRERGASAGAARARCAGDHARPLGVGAGGRPDGGGLRVDLPPPAGLRHLCRRDVAGLATQGVGRTLMEHVLADARRRGARTASLQSTRMGQPLYESLGFTPVGRYEEWVSR